MGYVGPCHAPALQNLYPGRSRRLPTPIITPFQPALSSPQNTAIGAITSDSELKSDTSAMLDTLFSTKFPLGFQGRAGPEMSLRKKGYSISSGPLVTRAPAEQRIQVDEEEVGVGREEEAGGSQCPVPSLLLPRGHSCSDNL